MLVRKDCEQIRMLRQELDTLEKKISHTPSREILGDTYGDYRTGYKHIRVIQGETDCRKRKLEEIYNRKAQILADKIAMIEEELDRIDDPEIRDIFRLYYEDGLSEEAVAKKKGYSRSAISTKINNFWNKNKL